MSEETKHPLKTNNTEAGPLCEEERLLTRYGQYVGDTGMSEAQQKELLLTLWQIMRAFVELGFSVKSGEKFTPESRLGMDDMLDYLSLEDTAHETVASKFNKNNEEA